MKTVLMMLVALLAPFVGASVFGCELPPEIAVPDGTTATEAEMRQGSDAVKHFIAQTQSYLQCLESEHDAARALDTNASPQHVVARENGMAQRHNDTVARMEAVIQAFNEAIADYEARSR